MEDAPPPRCSRCVCLTYVWYVPQVCEPYVCVPHTASLLQKEEDQKIRASKEARANWLSLKMAARLAALQVLSLLALLAQEYTY